MNKAAFLDRDGVINIEKNYLFRIEDFELVPGVINLLRTLQNNGFLLIIITNQSGIARGYYSEEDYQKLTDWMIGMLSDNGISITATYYCPHHPEAIVEKYKKKCDCRKPGTALFLQAIREYNIDLNNSIVIGDNMRDCEICKTSNCKGFLISNQYSIADVNKNITIVNSISDIFAYL